jgi:hypothetical protein
MMMSMDFAHGRVGVLCQNLLTNIYLRVHICKRIWFFTTVIQWKKRGVGGESEWLTDHKSCKWNWDLDNLDQWSNRWHNQCCWHQICSQKRRRKPTWYTTYKTSVVGTWTSNICSSSTLFVTKRFIVRY